MTTFNATILGYALPGPVFATDEDFDDLMELDKPGVWVFCDQEFQVFAYMMAWAQKEAESGKVRLEGRAVGWIYYLRANQNAMTNMEKIQDRYRFMATAFLMATTYEPVK